MTAGLRPPGDTGLRPGDPGHAPGRSGPAPGEAGSAPGRAGSAPGDAGPPPAGRRAAAEAGRVAPGSGVGEAFAEAMAQSVSRPAVVTARRGDGRPVGLLVSSLCSYSVRPPSVLLAVDAASRSRPALARCARFGVHLLAAEQAELARTFAGRGDDKFAGPDWGWHGEVPRFPAAPVFLDCVPVRLFTHGDHLILIGEVARVEARSAAPLLHHRRSLDWRISAADPDPVRSGRTDG